MSAWKVKNIEQSLERHGSHNELVILFHRWAGSSTEMRGVVAAISAARPDADVFVPELPFSGFWGRFSMVRAEDIAGGLMDAMMCSLKGACTMGVIMRASC